MAAFTTPEQMARARNCSPQPVWVWLQAGEHPCLACKAELSYPGALLQVLQPFISELFRIQALPDLLCAGFELNAQAIL